MAAFDFAFGLRGWGQEKFDTVEVDGLADFGEDAGLWVLKKSR
jgi:hypothetical protein